MTSKVYTTIKFEWERTDIIDEEMTVSSRAKVYEEIDSRIYFDEAREIVIKAKVNDKYDLHDDQIQGREDGHLRRVGERRDIHTTIKFDEARTCINDDECE